MKKLLSLLLAVTIFAIGTVAASALQSKLFPGLELKNDWDDNFMVTGYAGEAPAVVVPLQEYGKTVLRIDTNALNGNEVIQKLTMNDSMTNIRESGVRACPLLKEVYFSKSLKALEKYAFAQNPKLTSAFLRNTKLKEVGIGAFWTTSTEYVSLPDTLEKLENMAFQNTKVRMINIPDTVSSIGTYCFADCPELEKVYIPASVKSILSDAFTRSDKVTVYTTEGSAAKAYCAANGINCEIITDFPSRLEGDVNGDGKLDINDATYIQEEILGYKMVDFYADNSDYNSDCVLNIDDATEIQLHLAGLK